MRARCGMVAQKYGETGFFEYAISAGSRHPQFSDRPWQVAGLRVLIFSNLLITNDILSFSYNRYIDKINVLRAKPDRLLVLHGASSSTWGMGTKPGRARPSPYARRAKRAGLTAIVRLSLCYSQTAVCRLAATNSLSGDTLSSHAVSAV